MKMKQLLTGFLSRHSMYRLMLQFLCILVLVSAVLGKLGILPINPAEMLGTALFILISVWIFNTIFARVFQAQPNPESSLITAAILTLIVGPTNSFDNWLPLLVLAFAAMGSKYLIKIRGRHIFNPAAFGILVMSLVTGFGASWWVGIWPLTAITLFGGLLIAYKIRRIRMIAFYIISYLLLFYLFNGLQLSLEDNWLILKTVALNSPLFFFAFVMLPEPATSPAGQRLRLFYAFLVAFSSIIFQRFLPSLPYSLEATLLVGNLFTRLFERSDRYALTLVEKEKLSSTIWGYHFEPQPPVQYVAGQFMEWSVPHSNPDDRGTRRWFTIASSPTEQKVLLATRFSEKSSTYKDALQNLQVGQQIYAHGVEGDFVMPQDAGKPLVFIAGGIGITPFRSMVKHLLDQGQARDLILIYAVKSEEDLVFMDIFEEAKEAFGMKIVPVVSQPTAGWKGYSGQLTKEVLQREIPELKSQDYYVSGPEPMVEVAERMLVDIGVHPGSIHQDFFPGYANDLLTK